MVRAHPRAPHALPRSGADSGSLAPESMPEDSPIAMTRSKEVLVLTIMAAIMFLTGMYVGVEWAIYFHGFESRFPAGAGYARTCLCAGLVLLVGRDEIDKRDRWLLIAASVLAMVADYFLTLKDQNEIGAGIFLLIHALYVARHAQGFRASLAKAERARTIRWLVITGLVAFGGTAALIYAVAPILRRTGQLTLDTIYLAFLSTSLWAAWGAPIRRHYPRFNAWLVAVGMTSFYLCDVSVGLAIALKKTTAGAILDNLVGFFYTPALVLLALSGFRWSEQRFKHGVARVLHAAPRAPRLQSASKPAA